MRTIRISSVAFTGIDAIPVEVEIQKIRGLYGKVTIVGLPGGSVKESRDRVRAAICASGFPYPRGAMIINLAPADIRKDGPFFDLPIALGILAAEDVIPAESLAGFIILGELALDGRVKPVHGVLAAAILARKRRCRGILVASQNRKEAGLVDEIEVRTAGHLIHAASLFGGPVDERAGHGSSIPERLSLPDPLLLPDRDGESPCEIEERRYNPQLDYKDVVGQEAAKAAMVTAAAGGHNLLMIGPPGSGKTMLARRLPSILPPLDREESLDVSRIHSFSQRGLKRLIELPPFRAPHHTISYAGLVGGGSVPGPGEISLAHLGVLFLDELPEFARRTLEALRQPLEEGSITIVRVRGILTLPARITLVASMNPCPCGFRGDTRNPCSCTPHQASIYLKRISGPLLDRLDLQIEVPSVDPSVLQTANTGMDSAAMAQAVAMAREHQRRRSKKTGSKLNAHLTSDEIKRYCGMSDKASNHLGRCLKAYPFSARGYTRILKVARTLADLDSLAKIGVSHVRRAVMFRVLDRLRTFEA